MARYFSLLSQQSEWTPRAKSFARLYFVGVIFEFVAAYAHRHNPNDQIAQVIVCVVVGSLLLVTLYYGFLRREISWVVAGGRTLHGTLYGGKAMLVALLHMAFVITVALFIA